ncbi:CHAD domain-containing protein [Oricola cellulosilytica]|uniref:CHAD domain-containing protein n=1 Tax=Oricola cellulosilytica TaxID=1429082 RepID=UPI001304A72F|nr:CHAD domain-containing protein [Oricola cellulosilytica]
MAGEVSRIAARQYHRAIDILYTERGGRPTAIHDARKRFKKLRGLFRLVRDGTPDLYAGENARLRDAARSLSSARDAAALVETMDRLAGAGRYGDDQPTLYAIRHRLAARRDSVASGEEDLHARISSAIAACEEGIDAVSSLSLRGRNSRIIGKGFGRSYARARRAHVKANASGDPSDWHELRKRVKYHWMHVRLLRALWPGVMRLRAMRAKEGGNILGDEHDLSMLRALAVRDPEALGSEEDVEVLTRVATAETARLRQEFSRLAGDLLADEAGVVRSRVRALWRAAAD